MFRPLPAALAFALSVVAFFGAPTASQAAHRYLRFDVTYAGEAEAYEWGLQGGSNMQGENGVWGWEKANISWTFKGEITAVYAENKLVGVSPTGTHWYSTTMHGSMHQAASEGCPLGPDACPKPGTINYTPPCSQTLQLYKPWAEQGGGRLQANQPPDESEPDEIYIKMAIPLYTGALKTPDTQCASLSGGLANGLIYIFSKPASFNYGPVPESDVVTRADYRLAIDPEWDLQDPATTSDLGPEHLDVFWRWHAAENQVGNSKLPAVGRPYEYSVDINSTLTLRRT